MLARILSNNGTILSWLLMLLPMFGMTMFGVDDPPPGDPPPADPPPPAPPTDWRTGLDDEIKDHASLATFKSVNDLAKSHVSVQKLIGADKMIVPGENATDAEWNGTFDRLGRPSSHEGYKLDDVKLPEGHEFSKEKETAFLQMSHKAGLLPKQVNDIRKWYFDDVTSAINALNEANQTSANEATTKLRQEWGSAFDANMALAKKVVTKYADKDALAALDEGLGNDPRVARMMANIGKAMSEDALGAGVAEMTMTPAEAKQKISEVKFKYPDHPYYKKDHPEHAAAKKQMSDWYAMAFPEKPTG